MSIKALQVLLLSILFSIPNGLTWAQRTTVVEGESLVNARPPARASAGSISVQKMNRFGNSWTENEQLFWAATSANDRLTLPITIAADGTYQISIAFTQAPDYGQLRIGLNGKTVTTFDGYAPQVRHTSIKVATATLKAGENSLEIVVTGKARQSAGFLVGVDHVVIASTLAEIRPGMDHRLQPGRAITGQQNQSPEAGIRSPQQRAAQKIEQERLAKLVQEIQKPKLIPPSQTNIKVWTGQGEPGKEFFTCVDSFFISDQRDDLNWHFLWSTRQQGAAKAIYQVSLFPFDTSHDNWPNPPGLVASGFIPQTVLTDGTEQTFQIDLAELIPSRAGSKAILPPKHAGTLKRSRLQFQETTNPQAAETTGRLLPGLQRTDTLKPGANRLALQPGNQVLEQQEPGQRRPIGVSPNPPRFELVQPANLKPTNDLLEFSRVMPTQKRQVPLITFHIRVVTLREDNSIVGTPSKAAVLSYGEHKQAALDYLGDPNANQPDAPVFHTPECRIAEYRAFRDYQPDWSHHFIITKDFDFFGQRLYTKGQKVYWPPGGDDGWWDKVSDAFGSLVDFVKNALNAISNAYASIKSNVISFVAQNLPFCNPDCKVGLTFALDYGLASVGLPPSLPNFDDLKTLGKDYLIQVAADQSNLPIEEAVKVIDHYMEEVDNAASGGGWYKLDTSYQYSDAMLLVEVWNPTDKPTDPVYIRLSQFHKLFVLKDVGLGPMETLIPLPSIQPGQRIQVPVMMKPNSIQYTPGADFTQDIWNDMAGKGTTLTLYRGQQPDVIVVRNQDVKK